MNPQQRSSAGISLIEVLVSLVILSLGVLAVVALQMVSKRNNADAAQRTIAAQLAYDMIERMRANSSPAALAAYVAADDVGQGSIATEPTPDCSDGFPCNATQLAAHDLWEWEQAIDGAAEQTAGVSTGGLTLPTGCITLATPVGGGDGIYNVMIVWRSRLEMPDVQDDNVPCGNDLGDADLYGVNDEFRRTITVPSFITARVSP